MSGAFSFLSDPKWWAEQLVAWGVFTVLVAAIVIAYEAWRDSRRREPYTGWRIAVWGDDPSDAPDGKLQELHWEEVRRMQQSDFERWKTVKSLISGYCTINLARIDRAESKDDPSQAWCMLDFENRRLIVDLNRIPAGQRSAFRGDTPRCDSPPWGPHAAGAPRAGGVPSAGETREAVL